MGQNHLWISKEEISPLVLLPGDHGRVEKIGKHLEDFRVILRNREFWIGTGSFGGKKVTVCSTGIGCPSTAIAVEELIALGAKVLIRVGTCGGSWRADLKEGSVAIATASVRDEGTTLEYIPLGFPAVADVDVILALRASAERFNVPFAVGLNRTHDAFYGSQDAVLKWGKYLLDERWRKADTPILTSEMESSAIFVISSLHGVRAGAIFAVDANPEPLLARLRGEKQTVVAFDDKARSECTADLAAHIALSALVSF